jgi:pimeloyl-ACP methyl ester carboxylesterase
MQRTNQERNDTRACVVLIPGLWMPAWVMRPLEWRLARCGFSSVRFAYASMRANLDDNAARLARFIAASGLVRVHLVGHSLGGVLALHATARFELAAVHRIVMLGSPYRDSYAARKLARTGLGRRMLGRTIPQWLASARLPIPAGVEVGVIAGTANVGLGALVARGLPRPHDGVVCVQETIVGGAKANAQVATSHSLMLLSGEVGRNVCRFLRGGEFECGHARPAECVE